MSLVPELLISPYPLMFTAVSVNTNSTRIKRATMYQFGSGSLSPAHFGYIRLVVVVVVEQVEEENI